MTIVNQSAVWGPSIVYHGGGGVLDGLRGFQGERSPPPPYTLSPIKYKGGDYRKLTAN